MKQSKISDSDISKAAYDSIIKTMNRIFTYLQTLSTCYTTAAAERIAAINEQISFYCAIIRTALKSK